MRMSVREKVHHRPRTTTIRDIPTGVKRTLTLAGGQQLSLQGAHSKLLIERKSDLILRSNAFHWSILRIMEC